MHRFRSAAVGLLVPGVLVFGAGVGVAQAKSVRGTVVHRNASARSFVIADASGRLSAIHSTRRVGVGRVVIVSVRRLRNGTFAAKGIRVVGRRSHVRARGVVTFVDRARRTFTVSSRGVSMLVRDAHAGVARVADALPPVGTIVLVTGQPDDQGELVASSVTGEGTDTSAIDLEGAVQSIDTTARTLTVSADDNAESGQTITVTVPASFDLSLFTVGQQVGLQVTIQPDGSYLLQGSSSDQGVQGADDQGDEQGTDAGHQGDQTGQASNGAPSDSGSASTPSTPGSQD